MRRTGAALLLVALGWLLLPGSATAATSRSPDAPGPVVVVGVPGLRWDDVSERTTPTLWDLAGRSAIGSLSVRAARSVTCPADAWITLGTGNRARGPVHPVGGCPPALPLAVVPDDSGGADIPSFQALVEDNEELDFGSRLGALAEEVEGRGECVTAVGPGAGLAAADPSGSLERYARDLEGAALRECQLTIVALSPVERAHRGETLRALDAELARVLGEVARPDDRTTVLVAGVSETGPLPPRLHVAMAAGPYFDPGTLTSSSTRRAPFVQLIDVAPTVLSLLEIDAPSSMSGQRWRQHSTASEPLPERIDALVDVDVQAQAHRRLVPPFFAILVGTQIVLYGTAAYLLRRLRGSGRSASPEGTRIRVATSRVALAFAAAPVATYLANLVPWWRQDHLLLTLLAVTTAIVAAVVAVAELGPWRRRPLGAIGAVAGITALVLAVDLVTGAHLQLSSLAGYSPLVAGRFAGVGNVAYAVFATSALLLAAALVDGRGRRATLATCVSIGLAAIVIDGSPTFGSDFGGVLALVPGFAVLTMLAAGIRVSIGRVLVIAVVAVAAVAAFAYWDYTRPEDVRSHLGRFVGQIVDGEASTVIERKARANLRLLRHSVLTLLIPFATLFLTGVLLKPWGGLRRAFEQTPAIRAGLLGVLVMGVVGFLVNDSGVAVPALAMSVAVPAALAVSVAAVERDQRATPAATPPAAEPTGS